jgi:hypothetical protein
MIGSGLSRIRKPSHDGCCDGVLCINPVSDRVMCRAEIEIDQLDRWLYSALWPWIAILQIKTVEG